MNDQKKPVVDYPLQLRFREGTLDIPMDEELKAVLLFTAGKVKERGSSQITLDDLLQTYRSWSAVIVFPERPISALQCTQVARKPLK